LRAGGSEEDLRAFYRLYVITRKRVGRPCQPYRFFREVWRRFHGAGRLALLLARKEDSCIGGLLAFKYKDRVSAEWAASDERYKNFSPNHILFWEAIKQACFEGYKVFDFGRTSKSNKGLMDFKNRWGTEVSDMYQLFFPMEVSRRLGGEEGSWIKSLVSAACRNAPHCLQPAIGGFIYRHLG
jgi:lipid II:glycine glycyltransferase (peptidoglycan interpeptide bridge formation enzyme)